MFRKNDPLLGPIKGVMEKNTAQRKAVAEVNEQFGVHSRRALPLEKKAEYDIALKAKLSGDKILEESEQINEISKGKAGEYIKAAALDATRQGHKTELAVKQGKEEDAQKYIKKKYKRLDGINKAVNKLTKEDQLNELSDKTTKSYQSKAMDSAKKAIRKSDPKDVDHKTYNKRIKGLVAAKRKLAEDEKLDEAMKPSKIMSKYADNEDQNFHRNNDVLLAKHFGTPEEHANAVAFKKAHEKQGSLPMNHPLKAKVDAAADKHYKKLLQAVSQEKDADRAALKPKEPGNRASELQSRVAKIGAVAKFVKNSEKKGMSYPNRSRVWDPVKSTTHSDGDQDKVLKGTSDDALSRAKKLTAKVKGELKNVKKQGSLPIKEGYEHEYSKSEVDKAIKSSGRYGKKISGKEAKMIHAILKGRQKSDEPKKLKECDVEAVKKEIAESLFQKYEAVCENEVTLNAFLRDLSEEQVALLEGRAGGVVARPVTALPSQAPVASAAPKAGGLFGWGGFPSSQAAAAPAPSALPAGHAPVAAAPVARAQPSVGPGRSAAASSTAGPLFNPQPATMGRAAAPAAGSTPAPATAQTPAAAAQAAAPAPGASSPTIAAHPDPEAGTTTPIANASTEPATNGTAPATANRAQTPAARKTIATNRPVNARPPVRKPMQPKRGFGFGAGGSGSDSAGAITNRALGGVNEEVTPVQIKGSLEKFLRNKYLK